MAMNRRTIIKGLSAGAAASAVGAPAVLAQSKEPIRLGFMTVKTGPLASGGIQMEQGLTIFLKERGNMLAGRPVELTTVDTGGVPAVARTKIQELIERSRISCLIGPLSTQEVLALDDIIRDAKIPVIAQASADDLTQRRANPWYVRVTSSSGQCAHVMADYAAKELKYKRAAVIADDIAYGHEQNAAFLRVFEDAGGKVVQRLWPPLAVPDYGTYIAQLKTNLDALFMAFAGSNGFRFTRQLGEYGLVGKIPLIGGMTAVDEAVLQQMGDEALGIVSANYYSAELDNPINKKFVETFQRDYKVSPGYYGAYTYVAAAVLEHNLKAIDGKIEDKDAFMKALRTNTVPETVRGPVKFDEYGNIVGNIYIRKVERKGGRLVNTVIKTYPNVSQFWTYDPAAFLASPVYSRDYPAAKNIEP